MSTGPEFFQTMMGRKFFDADVPRFLRVLERIADALEAGNQQASADALEQVAVSSAFVMREAIADEVERLYGSEAAEQVRKVELSPTVHPSGTVTP